MRGNDTISFRRRIKRHPVGDFFGRIFLEEKLNNWVGWFLMAAVATVFGYLIATKTFLGLSLFGLVFGFFVIIACMISAELGLYINVCYSFFAFHFSRFLFNDEFPVGVITDILLLATFMSHILTGVNMKKSINRFTRTSVVIAILILLFYLLIELFNPYGHSFDGWFQTFRRFLGSVLLLFISYNVFTSYEKIRRFVGVLFVFCVISAIYGCIQQWHGLFNFELAWVRADDNRFGLFFIMGDFRKFSTMSDPTAFGVAMAAAALFFVILAWTEKNKTIKYTMFIGVIFMFLAMGYSGTRTANIMVAGGIVMYVLLTLDKKATRFFAVFAALVFLFLMYGPYVNSTILRFRTSFIGEKDESFKVREVNRAFIQPYIYQHPIGGGLGTTGASGLRFNRGHYLAGFPPDSGYLRKALETGWIGLALICTLYFLVLRYGVRRYFRCRDDQLKIIYAGAIASLFSFYLAEFAQEAIGQITDIVIYYPFIAMMLKMEYFPGFRGANRLKLEEEAQL
jgi:putative inorganic carbon (HCO3(-)) transporter